MFERAVGHRGKEKLSKRWEITDKLLTISRQKTPYAEKRSINGVHQRRRAWISGRRGLMLQTSARKKWGEHGVEHHAHTPQDLLDRRLLTSDAALWEKEILNLESFLLLLLLFFSSPIPVCKLPLFLFGIRVHMCRVHTWDLLSSWFPHTQNMWRIVLDIRFRNLPLGSEFHFGHSNAISVRHRIQPFYFGGICVR